MRPDPATPAQRRAGGGLFRLIPKAMAEGVPVEGICLYPVIDYPGWENDRHCEVGLLCRADEHGRRAVYEPLAEELRRQQAIFETLLSERRAPLRLVGGAE